MRYLTEDFVSLSIEEMNAINGGAEFDPGNIETVTGFTGLGPTDEYGDHRIYEMNDGSVYIETPGGTIVQAEYGPDGTITVPDDSSNNNNNNNNSGGGNGGSYSSGPTTGLGGGAGGGY